MPSAVGIWTYFFYCLGQAQYRTQICWMCREKHIREAFFFENWDEESKSIYIFQKYPLPKLIRMTCWLCLSTRQVFSSLRYYNERARDSLVSACRVFARGHELAAYRCSCVKSNLLRIAFEIQTCIKGTKYRVCGGSDFTSYIDYCLVMARAAIKGLEDL